MRAATSALLLALLIPFSAAIPAAHGNGHTARDLYAQHARLARRAAEAAPAPVPEPVSEAAPPKLVKKQLGKRCKPKSSSAAPAATTSAAPVANAAPAPNGTKKSKPTSSSSPAPKPSSTSAAPPAKTSQSGGGGGGGGSSGNLINVPASASSCGSPDPTSQDPNGAEWWLNCGLNGGGWQPPNVQLSDIVYVELSSVIDSDTFSPCKPYLDLFNQYAGSSGVPAIFLASFAMQESGCNPGAIGPNKEQGLMQLTADKCTASPQGNCKDPNYNIMTGANYIKSTIDSAGGNPILAVATYNGWTVGQTIDSVIAEMGGNCAAMQNLDYLEQFFNYWLQGKNAYSANAGSIQNLALCASGNLASIQI